jgi:hypothetical protein
MEDWRSPKHFPRSHCASWCCCGLFRKHHANYAACRLDSSYFYSCSLTMWVCIDHISATCQAAAYILHFVFLWLIMSHRMETFTGVSVVFFLCIDEIATHINISHAHRYLFSPVATLVHRTKNQSKFARLQKKTDSHVDLPVRTSHVIETIVRRDVMLPGSGRR